MFGTRFMAILYGIVFLGHQVGNFSRVWLGGWLYDRTGSYDMVWWLGVAFPITAAFLHWPIRERSVLSGSGTRHFSLSQIPLSLKT
jgi:nitrate/nitrite transporter NarK